MQNSKILKKYFYLCYILITKQKIITMKNLSTLEKICFKLEGLNHFYASLEEAIAKKDVENEDRYFRLIFEISQEIDKLEKKLIKENKNTKVCGQP